MSVGELTVVTKTYDLTLWLLTQINKLPRSYRFVLGDRIENTTLDILELLLEATYERDRGGVLKRANLKLEKLRYLIRICKDLKLINLKSYEHLARQVNEVGMLIGGWARQQRRKQDEDA